MSQVMAIAFDVIETLFNLEPLQERLTAVAVPGEKLPVWFARILRDAFSLEVAGVYQSFEKSPSVR